MHNDTKLNNDLVLLIKKPLSVFVDINEVLEIDMTFELQKRLLIYKNDSQHIHSQTPGYIEVYNKPLCGYILYDFKNKHIYIEKEFIANIMSYIKKYKYYCKRK